MHSIVVGLNIKHAPLEALEKLSVHHSQNALCVQKLKAFAQLNGAVVVSTCNRLEFYASCEQVDEGLEKVSNFLLGQDASMSAAEKAHLKSLLYSYKDNQAIRHLFEVVTGLDSLIVGEMEIAGQVSRAYRVACKALTTDKLINVWFQRALSLGKKVRSETRISRYSTSIGRIAVDLAVRELGGIQDKRVLILGAGEMSKLTMKYLVAQQVSVVMVSNRSLDKAQQLADQYGFDAYPITDIATCLESADVVFSATAAKGCLINRPELDEIMIRRARRPLLCIDMAIPRDIDPEVRSLENVICYDINELRDVAHRHQGERLRAAKKAVQFIDEAAIDFERWQRSLEYIPTIDALRDRVDQIKEEKLEHAMSKLAGLTPNQKDTVQALAASIVNQVIHDPISSLNEMAGTEKSRSYAVVLQELFHLEPEVKSEQMRFAEKSKRGLL
ncbi:MAG: glutamyl-tRNA reductase [Raoultibacter sp.]